MDSIEQLAAALARSDAHLTLAGFVGSARGYVLARLLNETRSRLVVVVEPTAEAAEALLSDLNFFLGHDADDFSAPPGVLFYPAEESLPYESVVASAQAARARVATLFRLTQSDVPVRLLITSAAALVRQTIPRRVLGRASELVVKDEEIDRDRLLATLAAGGYVNVPLCEDPGTYALRGGTLDIFSPLDANPVRIELFGDVVESIREYEVATQRPHKPREDLVICPIREVVLDAETVERARDALAVLASEVDFPPRKLRVIREELENRINFFGIEAFLPGLYAEKETLLDYVRDCAWLWDKPGQCEDEVALMLEHATNAYEVSLSEHRLQFAPDRHFASLAAARHAPGLHLDASFEGEAAVRIDCPEPSELVARLVVARAAPNALDHLRPLHDFLREGRREGRTQVLVMGSLAQAERLRELLSDARIDARVDKKKFSLLRLETLRETQATAVIVIGELERGFVAGKVAFLAESEIFGVHQHRSRKKHAGGDFISDLKELKEGDALVHTDHGVGRYRGLQRLAIRGVEEDYLHLEYAGGDKLYLPVYRIGLVQRYAAAGQAVKLDKLGGNAWETKKQRVRDAVLAMAHDLLDLYAKRQLAKAPAFPAPGPELIEFEAAFPFDETPDQAQAIAAVIADLQKPTPMDRLVCGDVGYGKTEVALRAAYFAVLAGKQVAVLVPTTVLAQQHFQTFTERLKGLPVNVQVLSRFVDAKDSKQALQNLQSGGVDILIGTHRLLSHDVHFKNLGLVVIDEEQRFGVRHKERLRKMRNEVHVLTLSATPIPRTLHMSFAGIRDLSLITTPPADRLSIRTVVTRFDEEAIVEAIRREIQRGGQVYFVHNRVQSIASMADYVKRIVPEARVGIGHGQMSAETLEGVMMDFVQHKTNVLVCTTIIESGIDISSANTMIINRADAFGLSQLYQLRGRIGRSSDRAYAILLVPKSDKVTKEAQQRLEALQRFSELGAGFKIASHDLELRGSGNLLGPDQSGHVAAVGFELYTALVAEAVAELKGGLRSQAREPEIRLPVTALIPEKYVPDTGLRLNYYKRMAQGKTDEEIYDVLEELGEFYGTAPEAVERLVQLMLIKRRLQVVGALTLDGALQKDGGAKVSMLFEQTAPIDRGRIADLVQSQPEIARLTPDGKFVYAFSAKQVKTPDDLLAACKALLQQLTTYTVEQPAALAAMQ